jgi:uncharacterized protein YjiK
MSAAINGLVVLMVLLVPGHLLGQRTVRLQPASDIKVKVAEPSDIVFIPGSNPARFYVVSDNGYVAEMNNDGTIRRLTDEFAFDLEAVMLHDGELLVVDERTRRVLWLDTIDLSVKRRLTVPYGGGRNKGYEALAWNPLKERYLLITERNPVYIIELDREFRTVNEIDFDRSIRDISSATWHDEHLWLLSDMDMLLLKCDPQTYRILGRWHVPVLNPEGFAFDGSGNLFVISDDRQRMYAFPLPSNEAR